MSTWRSELGWHSSVLLDRMSYRSSSSPFITVYVWFGCR